MESEVCLEVAALTQKSINVSKLVDVQQRAAEFDPPTLLYQLKAISSFGGIGFALKR